MLVKFVSSETGEMIMFAEHACQLLSAIGKECTARGTFTVEEMLPAAAALRRAVEGSGSAEKPPETAAKEGEGKEEEEKEPPIALGRRAWPFIEMLERTGRAGKRANIIWEAPKDFAKAA